ncbi:MAG: hypothetical protein M5U28_33640 [Sandaracinaceae bacterium]|nr:hypothetical protein [Sandaracinaceae bacterium]
MLDPERPVHPALHHPRPHQARLVAFHLDPRRRELFERALAAQAPRREPHPHASEAARSPLAPTCQRTSLERASREPDQS